MEKDAFLNDVDPGSEFITKRGERIRNLKELSVSLEMMDDHVFDHHMSPMHNDFMAWISGSVGDDVLSGRLKNITDKNGIAMLINQRVGELSLAQNTLDDTCILAMAQSIAPAVVHKEPAALPADSPPDAGQQPASPLPIKDQGMPEQPQEPSIAAPEIGPDDHVAQLPDSEEKTPGSVAASVQEPSQSPEKNQYENKSAARKKQEDQPEATVEIRDIEVSPLGLKELDRIFKGGLPKICNLMFIGEMSTGKTITALKLMLAHAKKGEKTVYLSLQDSEEKIINVLKSMDPNILNYLNSGFIMIKKIDTFHMAEMGDLQHGEKLREHKSSLDFIKEFSPSLVIVDSLSTLDLSFPDDKRLYRTHVSSMFVFFEKLGVRAIFLRELVKAEDLHKEFFENILADCIVYFEKDKKARTVIRLIKEYPVPVKPKRSGFLGLW